MHNSINTYSRTRDRSKCEDASGAIPESVRASTCQIKAIIIWQNAVRRDRYSFEPRHDGIDKRTMVRWTFTYM